MTCGCPPPGDCPECGEEMDHVHEPMVSGFVGDVCNNDDCPRDS